MSRRGQIIKRAGQERRQEIVKLIKQAAYYGEATWRIWEDAMCMFATALAQPVQWEQEREDEYMRRIEKYDKRIQDIFPQMFTEIVLAYEEEGCADILGGMYMQLEFQNHWKGQFFTPDTVCQAMARMLYQDTSELIEKQGYITVNDPTCGAGAMLIAFARTCLENDINYQRDVLFVAQDIDPVVAHMCYISMSLLGMSGCVIIGNTLTNDVSNYDYWYTPMYFVQGFPIRRQRKNAIDATREAMALFADPHVPDDSTAEPKVPTLLSEETSPELNEYNVTTTGQLTLFR